MVNYTCPRCGYTSHIKTIYERHLSRKKICENIVSDDDLSNEYKKYNIKKEIYNLCSAKKPPKTAKTKISPPKTAKFRQNLDFSNDSFKCEYCDKNFTRKDSLVKHLNGRCKIKIKLENEKNELYEVV